MFIQCPFVSKSILTPLCVKFSEGIFNELAVFGSHHTGNLLLCALSTLAPHRQPLVLNVLLPLHVIFERLVLVKQLGLFFTLEHCRVLDYSLGAWVSRVLALCGRSLITVLLVLLVFLVEIDLVSLSGDHVPRQRRR